MSVKSVYTYLSPDEVIEGFYMFDGKTVTMMGADHDGTWLPLAPQDEIISEPATPETAVAVAKTLTKRTHAMLNVETVKGFGKGRRISYPIGSIV